MSTPLDVDTDSAGVTTYKAVVTNTAGTDVRLIVDSTGAAATQAGGGHHSHGIPADDVTVLFSAAPQVVQDGLTTLATAAGVTLAASTALDVDTDSAGVTTYKAEVTDSSGNDVRLVVDSTGAASTQQGHGRC